MYYIRKCIISLYVELNNSAALGRLDPQEQLYLNQLSNLRNAPVSNAHNPNQMQNFRGGFQNFNQITPYIDTQSKFV